MAVLISGKLIGPNGDPRPGVTIMLTAVKTSSAVVHLAPSSSTTGADGSYSLSVEVGTHNVMIEAYGRPFEKVGQITVYSDSKPGTLNDFLTSPGQDELTPAIVAIVDDMRAAAAEYAQQAMLARDQAADSASKAQNIADANTYYIKPADPDGTIAGLAGTPSGQSFRVAQGPGNGFKYFRNDSGVAVEVAAIAGEAAIAAVQAVQQFLSAMTPADLTAATPDWLHAWTDSDKKMVGGFDLTGGLNLCGMPDAVQDRLRGLADYLTTVRIPGYHDVVLDGQGKTGYAIRDDWSMLLAGLDKSVQDEINDLKTGGGSALLRPYNGLLAVFKDTISTTPVYAVNPVAYASKLNVGGASIVYDENGITKTGTINLIENTAFPVTPNNWIQRPIPSFVKEVFYRYGIGQSLVVGGGNRVTNVDQNFLGQHFVFTGAGGDRGAGGNGTAEGAVTPENLNVFKDAESIGIFRENCIVPGGQRFQNDLVNLYGYDKYSVPAILSRIDGKSGTAYAGLKKGTQVYTDGLTSFTTFVKLCIEQGKIPVSHSVICKHGEQDSRDVTTLGQYGGYLNEWFNDISDSHTSILIANGITQTLTTTFYVDQMGSIKKTATNRGDLIAFDQLAISNSRADVVCTGPSFHLNRKYPLLTNGVVAPDEVHMSGTGYAIMGEYHGQAEAFMYKERLAGKNKKWTPVQPISVVKNGLDCDVTFPSPLGLPLKENFKYGTAPNLGVDVKNGSANIVSFNQVSDFVFRFTLDKEPAPGEFLRFGFNSTDSHYPLVCISDTSTRVSKSDPTFVMENFCCLSQIAIS